MSKLSDEGPQRNHKQDTNDLSGNLTCGSGPEIIHGFELVAEEYVPERDSTARLFTHLRTGMPVLIVENDDENKVFTVSFKTPGSDQTGVPHVLEHSVLKGSSKFRVKDMFAELMKGSMVTFLNAYTADDHTYYPLASNNDVDFQNLVSVYLNIVFEPLLERGIFDEQCWHYELDDQGNLIYNGVVLSEMKGAMSDPNAILGDAIAKSLFPDTQYRYNTGGDPTAITDLTYDAFKAFYDKHYHPSNAFAFFWGNGDTEAQLKLVDQAIGHYEKRPEAIEIIAQPRFEEPKTVVVNYSVQKGKEGKSQVSVNWLLGERNNPEEAMALMFLDYVLMMSESAPLKRTLIESELGEGMSRMGIDGSYREDCFSVGLRGVVPSDCKKVEALVLSTLEKLASDGLPQEELAAALNIFEFSMRENNFGRQPQGFTVMGLATQKWLYGQELIESVKFESALAALKENLAADPHYLESLIEKYFLKNSHRTTVFLHPEEEKSTRETKEEKEKLAQIKASMGDENVKKIRQAMADRERKQQIPDSPEALAAIPRLAVSDLSKKQEIIPVKFYQHGKTTILHTPLETKGRCYLTLTVDLSALPQHLLPYVPVFTNCLTGMGTSKEDYVSLARRINRTTGGIFCNSMVMSMKDTGEVLPQLMIYGKATIERSSELTDLLGEICQTISFEDQSRFRQIVQKSKAGMQSALLQNGHRFAMSRAAAATEDRQSWISEQLGGISQMDFLTDLAERVDTNWPEVKRELEEVYARVINRKTLTASVTVNAAHFDQIEKQITRLLDQFPESDRQQERWMTEGGLSPEGLIVQAPVNYVAKSAYLPELKELSPGAAAVVIKYINDTYLWDLIRVEGGAYGAYMSCDVLRGVVSAGSYRDPNLEKTLEVYDQLASHLTAIELTRSEVERYIIGAINRQDPHRLVDQKGGQALQRFMTGWDQAALQKFRDQIFATTVEDFREFGQALQRFAAEGRVVVLGSKQAIDQYQEESGIELQIRPAY